MKQILKLVFLLVIGQTAFGQAPSNYTNINGRYRWIAGMFDSTFHIPKGSTPSLRTGGSTNSGGLFYNTSDSSVYTYTGTQWIKLRGSINPSDTTNKYVTQVYKKNASDSVFYVKGGNHLFAFIDSVGSPGGGGGGKVYYFNGGVSMGTFGGFTMYELGDTANTGAAANFTRSTTGNIANFITDPGKPGLLQIPAGVWSVDAWLSETGGGANHAEIWVEVEKWDGSTITTIATSPIEQITEGATPNLYSWSVSIPTTSLTVTDRIIIQFYISNTNGKTVTLYTQNGYVGEVHTTFTTGIGAINGLTAPAQYLVTGTSGTDFNINSSTATHTFNLPTASATNRGALSTTDWSTFNNKIGGSGTTNYVSKFTGSGTIGNSTMQDDGTNIGIGITPSASIFNQLQVQYAVLMGNSSDATANYLGSNFYLGAGAQWKYIASNQASQFAQTSGGFNWNTAPVGTAGNNLTWTTRMQLTNAGLLGVGTSFIDSNLTVGLGTHLKRGVRMSALPTGVGTKALRIDANGTLSVADTLTNGVSGSLTANFIPKATGATTLNNSPLSVGSSVVGLGLGVVPPNSWSNYWALQLANGVSLASYNYADIPIGWLGTNAYHDGIGDIRVSNGAANKYLQDRGNHKWYVAGYGASGSYISWTQPMILDTLNRLTIGVTTPDSMFKVAQGVHLERGVRMSGLPTGVGTKAVRINANGTLSVADTLANGISGTGTTNYIPKFTSSSAIGNSQIFDNGTSVGIGTSSPSSLLSVGANVVTALNSSELLQLGKTSDAFMTITDGSGRTIFGTTNGIGFVGNYSNTDFTFRTTNAERMRLTSGGSLGLGTSSPNSAGVDIALTINGGTNSILEMNYGGTRGGFLFANSSNVVLSSVQSLPLLFNTGNIERMRLDASGRLGINTSSPAYRLDVNGSGRINGTLNLPTSADIVIGTAWNTGTLNFLNGVTTYLTFDVPNSRIDNRLTKYYVGGAKGFFGTYDNYGVGFVTNNTEKLTLDVSGNLGLGVSPSAWSSFTALQLGGNTYSAVGSSNGYMLVSANAFFDGTGFKYISSAAASRYLQNSGQHQWEVASSGTAGNAISFTQAMTLDASGRLGIGTTSPSFIFDAQTSSLSVGRFLSNASGKRNNILIQNSANYNYGVVGVVSATGTSTGDVYGLGYSASGSTAFTEVLNWTSGGNVGIGTTSPGYRLEVNGDIGFSGGASLKWGGNTYIYGNNNVQLEARVNGNLGWYINSSGNVGIGTTSPAYKLTVQESGAAGAPLFAFIGNSSNGNYMRGYWFKSDGTTALAQLTVQDGDAMYTGTYTSIPYILQTGGSERMRITSGGDVGIGTTSPSYKLVVSKAGAEGIEFDAGTIIAGRNYIINYNRTTNAYTDFQLDANNILFSVIGTEKMRITSGGELLINTTSDAGDYKLQVNGSVRFAGDTYLGGIINTYAGDAQIWVPNFGKAFTIKQSTGNAEFESSIKTAAPSGGTAAAWKLGSRVASSGVTFNDQQYIQLDIGGTLYYLATVDLPMPEAYPQATSGPSNNYKMAPVQVKTTKDAEIEKLRKEIEELKQLIKNK